MSVGNVGGLSQAPSETENDRRTEGSRQDFGSPAGDLGQPTPGTNRQSCQRVLKATEKPVLQLRVDISNIHSNCNVVTYLLERLLRDCLDIFERAKIARWQHCHADNIRTL